VMLLSSQTSNFYDKCILHTNIILILVITLLILLLGKRIAISIGTTGIRIIQRVMGLILMVISIQFIINGITPILKEIIPN
jgi:multiple antibiotic resistance protein